MPNFANSQNISGWSGRLLAQALNEPALLTLTFYTYGILLRKPTETGFTEYPVDPAHVAQALAARVRFSTGLLLDDILFIISEGVRQTVIGYRKPQHTGIYLEGSTEPLRVPLPGLVMIRCATNNARNYQVYAVKERPSTPDTMLFHAPFPNVYSHGAICWGNVPFSSVKGASLVDDWRVFFGTTFGGHAVSGKSKKYPTDVRLRLLELARCENHAYPKRDLISMNRTLRQVMKKEDIADDSQDF